MTYRMFLDDERFPADKDADMIIVRNLDEVKKIVEEKGFPVYISFDHDLGSSENGLEVARWLVIYLMNRNEDLPPGFSYTVHSMNPVGREDIIGYMDSFIRNWN